MHACMRLHAVFPVPVAPDYSRSCVQPLPESSEGHYSSSAAHKINRNMFFLTTAHFVISPHDLWQVMIAPRTFRVPSSCHLRRWLPLDLEAVERMKAQSEGLKCSNTFCQSPLESMFDKDHWKLSKLQCMRPQVPGHLQVASVAILWKSIKLGLAKCSPPSQLLVERLTVEAESKHQWWWLESSDICLCPAPELCSAWIQPLTESNNCWWCLRMRKT